MFIDVFLVRVLFIFGDAFIFNKVSTSFEKMDCFFDMKEDTSFITFFTHLKLVMHLFTW